MINAKNEYPGRIGSASPQYPTGEAIDETVDGANDGTPVKASWVNDVFGFFQALLASVGDVASGVTETATASQLLDAINTLIANATPTLNTFEVAPVLAGAFNTARNVDVATETTAPQHGTLSPDGLQLFVGGSGGIYAYNLSTANDLNTAIYSGNVLDTTGEASSSDAAAFSPDGLTVFSLHVTSDTIFQYDLTTAWDVTTGSYSGNSLVVTAQDATPLGLAVRPDGLLLVVSGAANRRMNQYTLTTAWDLSTASFTTHSNLVFNSAGTFGYFAMDSTGQYMFLMNEWVVGSLSVVRLDVPWVFGTSGAYTFDQNTNVSTDLTDAAIRGIHFRPDDGALILAGDANNTIYEFSTTRLARL